MDAQLILYIPFSSKQVKGSMDIQVRVALIACATRSMSALLKSSTNELSNAPGLFKATYSAENFIFSKPKHLSELTSTYLTNILVNFFTMSCCIDL